MLLVLFTSGKGYPDYATRRLLTKLTNALDIPAFLLVDADPHGLSIAATYRWGTKGCLDPELYIPRQVPLSLSKFWLYLNELRSLNRANSQNSVSVIGSSSLASCLLNWTTLDRDWMSSGKRWRIGKFWDSTVSCLEFRIRWAICLPL